MNALHELLAPSLALALSVLGLAALRARKAESPRQRSQRGIEINLALRGLLHDLQLHRGMASILLNGNPAFSTRLQAKQAEIHHALRALVDAPPTPDLLAPPRIEQLRTTWDTLRSQVLSLSPLQSFARHSILIQDVLRLISDVAERSQLDAGSPVSPSLTDMIWRRLPEVAEGIGKARAIGSGIAAAGQASGVDRIRLRFLVTHIRDGLKVVQTAIGRDGGPLSREAMQAAAKAQGTGGRLLSLIESELIAVECPNIDAEAYFAAATDALEDIYRVYDAASASLAQPSSHRTPADASLKAAAVPAA